MSTRDRVRSQYQREPYPPIPWFALPSLSQGEGEVERLSFRGDKEGLRILVAGAGTFEALMVALANPRAKEIVALDLSGASLRRLKMRWWLSRMARLYQPHPRLKCVEADLMEWQPSQQFDFILASNVLHHLEDPALALKRLSSWLKEGGALRLVTYPKMSRVWMRETSRWLKAQGLTPEMEGLVKRARQLISALPKNSPLRSAFESQPETGTRTGLVDAFFHACENPLHPLQWAQAVHEAGLRLEREDQAKDSRSTFLDGIFPEAKTMHPWMKLQVLDDLLELCSNPVLWLRKGAVESTFSGHAVHPEFFQEMSMERGEEWSVAKSEIRAALRRVDLVLSVAGLTPQQIQQRIFEKLTPQTYPGLSLADSPGREIVSAHLNEKRETQDGGKGKGNC